MKDLTLSRPTIITRSRLLQGNKVLRQFMGANDEYFTWDGLMRVADRIEMMFNGESEPWLITIKRQEDLTFRCQISYFSQRIFEKCYTIDVISDERKCCLWLACVSFAKLYSR